MVEDFSFLDSVKGNTSSPVISFIGAVCFSVTWALALTWSAQAEQSYGVKISKGTIVFTPETPSAKTIVWKCSNIFGAQNVKILNDGTLEVAFPAGSFSPERSTVVWGFWAICPFESSEKTTHAKLSYTLTFAGNFDFVKWGKLPGLCGGTCPRWGENTWDGFSTRFMWRRKGALEVYLYSPSASEQSVGRGMFTFEPWKTYRISQEIQMNTPGKSDGSIQVFIDEKLVYTNTAMFFRNSSEILPDTVFFSTFFWGGDTTWATPIDTSIIFWDFTLSWK